MRNFLLFTLLMGGLFSLVMTNFLTLDENSELFLDNSGPYIGAEFPKQLGFTGKGEISVEGNSTVAPVANQQRSEERRVGKECRSRWSPYH